MFWDSERARATGELHTQLRRLVELRSKRSAEAVHSRTLVATEWRSRQMWRTYADLLAKPRFKPAVEFFLTELYSNKDISKRDRDFRRIAPLMANMLPSDAVETMATLIEMNALTEELDLQVQQHLPTEVSRAEELTQQVYAEACRRAAHRKEREHQCALFQRVCRDLHRIVSNVWVERALHFSGRPSRIAGLGEFHDFLVHGHTAIGHLGDGDEFLETVLTREMKIIERVYAEHPQPFDLEVP